MIKPGIKPTTSQFQFSELEIYFSLICNQKAFWTYNVFAAAFTHAFHCCPNPVHQCSASPMHELTKNVCPRLSVLHKCCCINKWMVRLGSGSCWWQSLFSYSTYTTLQPLTHSRCLTCQCPGGVRDTFSEPLENCFSSSTDLRPPSHSWLFTTLGLLSRSSLILSAALKINNKVMKCEPGVSSSLRPLVGHKEGHQMHINAP